MSTTLYNPAAAAAIIRISPSTLRNWIRQFAAHLSPTANPPPGAERVLTQRDVAILQRVKELRDQFKGYDEIESILATMPAEEAVTPYIDAGPPVIEVAPEPPRTADTTMQVISYIDDRIEARYNTLQGQIDDLKTGQASRMAWFVYGFIAAFLFVAVIVLIMLLARP